MDDTVNARFDGANGRSERGRFLPGNSAAKGNPQKKRMADLRRLVLDAVDPVKLAEAVQLQGEQAAKGDRDSLKLLLEYTIGKPAAAVELSGADGEPPGVNVAAVLSVVLGALSGPEHAEARVSIAAKLKELDDAGDRDAE